MVKTTLKFRLHRTAIVLICLALLAVLTQGASVCDDDGTLLAHSGKTINVRDRLALDGQQAGRVARTRPYFS